MLVLPINWPKYWSFGFSIRPSNEYSRLISFRIGYFDLFAVQGTLKSLLWHQNLTYSNLQCSAFFFFFFVFFLMGQLSHSTWLLEKTIALGIQAMVSKVKSLFFYVLSKFVPACLQRNNCLLISRLQSLSPWFWSPRKENLSLLHCFPFICHEVMGRDAMTLVFWMLRFKPVFSLLFHLYQE